MSAAPSSPSASGSVAPMSPKVAPKSPSAAASPKSPAATSGKKRGASEGASDAAQGSAKKGKAEGYQLNMNKALDKEHEGLTFKEIIKLPPSALQGLSGKADAFLAAFKINTIEDLANWRFFKIARAIVTLAAVEEKGKRPAASRANINKALDKAFETESFVNIAKQPVSAMQGLAEWADPVLKPLGAGKISQLGSWRFCLWAEAFVELAAFESEDMSS